ncbi:amidohydrolase family protein [Microbulbifer agarilyticus]|uniref:metal-dependent hydrolase family protein n=1 Tax=Microbulbifer agarilyticus TaxID=260552 RepID=UPI001C985F7B|nr:amidohydrolase family protein [Microbulbifer agarilyticus]MBY6188838.1 amidohydrolase family protein [Microbulbifer agarilyticus]
MNTRFSELLFSLVLALSIPIAALAHTGNKEKPTSPPNEDSSVLFKNANVFDGESDSLQSDVDVLVQGNLIKKIGKGLTADNAQVIDAGGRVLMPGLIDVHWHTTYAYTPASVLMNNQGDILEVAIRSMTGAKATLMRGFTTVRDPGGNSFAIKKLIDSGEYPGHRILPSGPFMSQTSGHADFRSNLEIPANPVDGLTYWEKNMMVLVSDGVPDVRRRTREILRYGATQIKITTGGGVSSLYDPLDVSEYSLAEIKAVVEEAENFNTYVLAHVMTDKGIRRSIEAGVKSIEHGYFASDDTLKLMKKKGIWLSPQPFEMDDNSWDDPESAKKWRKVVAAVNNVYTNAARIGVKIAFGTDLLLDAEATKKQNALLVRLGKWFTPFEVLKIATSGNAELLEMSGPRHPYKEGPLGVIREGAYADLLLVDGNPLRELDLIANPHDNFLVIMKDGKIYKNTLK